MNHKRVTITAMSLVFMLAAMFGQRRAAELDVTRFHEHKWNVIQERAGLSPAEASVVKPIFMEYEKKVWELHMGGRNLYRGGGKNEELTAAQYEELNEKIVNIEIQKAALLKDYHERLKKQLKQKSLYQYYRAQKAYERQLLQRGPEQHPNRARGGEKK